MTILGRRIKPRPVKLYKSGAPAEPIQVRARKKYRESQPDFELGSCLRSLDYFEDEAEHIPVAFEGSDTIFTAPVYAVTKVAELLEKSYQTFWRWTKGDAIIPPPVLVRKDGGRVREVYHREEVRQMITIIGKHERDFKYYRKSHLATRRQLLEAIDNVRNEIKQENENASDQTHPSPPKRRLAKVRRVG